MASYAHSGFGRTYTAPTLAMRTNPLTQRSVDMGHAPRTSQLSGSTAVSSASTTSLSSMSTAQTLVSSISGGPVIATDNIINQRADASRSLYQICVSLRHRLRQVPSFDEHLSDSAEDDEGEDEDDNDPVSSLWRCLRKGYPLMTIYNALQPATPLEVDEGTVAERNRPKSAAFKFVQACLKDLRLPAAQCFVLTDLFGNDTSGFVKVTQVVNLVLDVAEKRGLLLDPTSAVAEPSAENGTTQMSYRDHVVRELVDTERKYVQDLENLHELKKTIEQKGVITGDLVHDIFLNINAILDFQRRFLIKIETTNSMPDSRQEWGLPFINYEEAFGIYQPFIANQRKAASIAMREFDKISQAEHPVVVDFNTLDGFLLKPMQRLVKYPLLLKDLRDKTNANEATKQDLTAGIDAANRVLHQANAAVDRELRNEAQAELCRRVDDWKSHDIDHFGDLLLHGQFTVVTGKSDVEKEFSIYLFERILLCCKEINPNKAAKDKLLAGPKKDKKDKEKKDKKDKSGKAGKLQLKGRIFMTNVTDVISLVKPGSYTVQIWWKGDPGVENFIIRFTNEEVMKKWSNAVSRQKHICAERGHDDPGTSAVNGTTNFAWMREQQGLPNPYAQPEEEEEDELGSSLAQNGHQMPSMSRNASSTSLRSRSTTGESAQSLAGTTRQPPPRFPMGYQTPPLSLQTQLPPHVPSPGPKGGESYFSPVAESPASSRTSQNSIYPFPRQGTPQSNYEEHNRYTAPAMARAPSRDSQQAATHYNTSARNPQRPSLPAISSQSQTGPLQRSRSYSTADVNVPNGPVRRMPNNTVPAVPGIPAHLAYDASIPRSQSNSPSAGLPSRSNTQSPGVQRERQLHPPGQYANGPQYLRSNTTMSSMDQRTMSPPVAKQRISQGESNMPTQLKVKVNCDGNYVTLVVAFNITYQSLIDRIDAKVGRFSHNAIARGTMRLKYKDEDGELVSIDSDDDIQIAFQEWREEQQIQTHGAMGEIELYCQSIDN